MYLNAYILLFIKNPNQKKYINITKQDQENILSFCKKKRRKYLVIQKKALSLHSLS